MNLFYTPHIHTGQAILAEEEARHCVQVLRHRPGDAVRVVDGRGGFYEGVLEQAGKRECVIRIEREWQEWGRRPYRLHLAVAPTKSIDRFEWFLEKAVEIGVDEISPLLCEHSERRQLRVDRLQKVALSAMKQSLKAYLPEVNELRSFSQFLRELEGDGQRFIAHCREGDKASLKDNYRPGSDVIILVGPEGDFSEEEIRQAGEAGFEPVHLGESRLRTETAGVVACHTIYLLNS
ncbi:MAG: 16S rRNA (uracil(1498)-N(3))-methyltransferase [Saprospiraceae bacterium]|nr:16S rRNA (uracil(1498)-N(3))-methyltransferase [Saprospiraceae bacterium]MCB0683446.1 16S rRNA (uracil(1498)-N(3))-methyltransferase [Saprospiraceae bacterium]